MQDQFLSWVLSSQQETSQITLVNSSHSKPFAEIKGTVRFAIDYCLGSLGLRWARGQCLSYWFFTRASQGPCPRARVWSLPVKQGQLAFKEATRKVWLGDSELGIQHASALTSLLQDSGCEPTTATLILPKHRSSLAAS